MNRKNEHFMGCIVGREGSGKSVTAVAIASLIDPEFTADDVYFDPQELLRAFDSSEYSQGNMIVLDEAGVGMGKRSWYDKAQILMNQTLQTVRDDNMGVIFTLPRLEELDSQTIGRFHAFLEMEGVDSSGKFARLRWKDITMSRDGRGNEYYQYPRMYIDGTKRKITEIGVGAPPAELEENYQERKAEFKDRLYTEAIDAYDEEEEGEKENLSPKEVAKAIADDGVESFVSLNNSTKQPYINKELIRVEYGLSHKDASAVKSLLQRSFTDSEIEGAV